MVSSSSAQQAALFVSSSNPLILSSSASTPSNNNVITSVAAQNHHSFAQAANHQQQQQFLQLIQNQQRPLLYSPQMFLPCQNQLLTTTAKPATNSLSTTANSDQQQQVLISRNLMSPQFLLNKNLIDLQKNNKSIIIPGQQTANLQPRSHFISNLQTQQQQQQFKSQTHLLTAQSPLLNQAQFLAGPIQWPPNPPILFRPQQPLFLHTSVANNSQPTTPIILNPQSNCNQNGSIQLVQSSSSTKKDQQTTEKQLKTTKAVGRPPKESTSSKDKTTTNDEKSAGSFLHSPTKAEIPSKLKRQNNLLLAKRKQLGERIKENNGRGEKIKVKSTRKQSSHKSTQQMNDELLLKKEKFDALERLKLAKKNLAKEKKKNVSIVKPRVLLNHQVSGYLIQESDKPFNAIDNDCKIVDQTILVPVDEDDQGGKLKKVNKKQKKVKLDVKQVDSKSKNNNSNETSTQPLSTEHVEINDNQDEKPYYLNMPLSKWKVDDVFNFVLKTTSNKEFADTLKREQFNGLSLLLLKIPILRKFELKLGPILLLIKKIEELKAKHKSENGHSLPSLNHISKWTVDEVYDFILNLTDDQTYADEFRKQEIDGHSLTLITEDHLRTDLKLAYGQSLLIIEEINKLKSN